MKSSIRGTLTGIALASCFAASAMAEDGQRCASENVLIYDLQSHGETLQSRGDVTSDPEVHSIEMYANSDTGRWTLVELKDGGEACVYKVGAIFFNEGAQNGDGEKTLRQGAMALHGNGDGSNEAFEFFAHQATGRWFLSRRTSETKSEVVLAGNNYREEHNLPYQPNVRIKAQPEAY